MKAAEKIETEKETLSVIQYNITDAAIAKMEGKYKNLKITDLKDTKGYEEVRLAIADVRTRRTSVEDKRVELKKDALEFGRKVDKEAKRITALLLAIEEPLKAKKQKIDDEKDRIKREAEEKEKERVEGIRAKITAMQKVLPRIVLDYTIPQLTEALDKFLGEPATEEVYQEFTAEAVGIWEQVVSDISSAIEAREKLDKEEVERKAESERLEKVRQEQEAVRLAQEAEAKRLDNLRKAEEEKVRKEREALEAEKRKIQEDKDRAEFERKTKEKAEAEAKAKVEREEQERKDREAKAAKEEADRKAAEALEKARQEALKPDREKIMAYGDALLSMVEPQVSDKKAKRIVNEACNRLQDIVNDMRNAAEAL